MEGLVESIVSKGKRTEEQWEAAKKIDEAHQKELRLVLEKVKLLWYDKNPFRSSATNIRTASRHTELVQGFQCAA